jgi:hypothetical protein
MESKQAIRGQQLVIVHISFDNKDEKQTGNHKTGWAFTNV